MSLSLNEVEATAKKAARGAGYSWGLSEEAAKATRWLCANGIDGCAALARLLSRTDGTDLAAWSPRRSGAQLEAVQGILCPLIAGAALSDTAELLKTGGVRLGRTIEPILIVPFAASVAQQLQGVVALSLSEAEMTTDGNNLSVEGLPGAETDSMTLRIGALMGQSTPISVRAVPDAGSWQTLLAFAQRTYAPATEASRLSGAGAGLSDND